MVRPDLSIPTLPDAEEMDQQQRAKQFGRGGTNLRDSSGIAEDFEWPEAGPSSQPMSSIPEKQARIGPFGAKLVAAMTGAVATSLLMTPFDVIKTRLQTVQPSPRLEFLPNPEECCQTSVLTPASSASSRKPLPSTPANPLTCYTAAPTPPRQSSSLSFASLRPASTPAQPPSGCLQPSKWAGMWGEAVTLEEALARGVVSINGGGTIVLPSTGEPLLGGFWNEIAAIRGENGVRGLWKGVGTTLTMSIPSAAIYMLGYEFLLGRISPFFTGSADPAANTSSLNLNSSTQSFPPNSTISPTSNVPHVTPSSSSAVLTPAPLIAGSLARTWSATVISPIEMFRTRLLARPTSGETPTYASTFKGLGQLVRSKGPTILWRGLGPTLWRDVPFSGLYWAGFEILKAHLSSPQSSLPPMAPVYVSFISGAVSGTISALFTQPFDVLKTRRQVFTPSPNCSPAALNSHASTLPLAMHVIKTEGWRSLFAGLSARCGKVAPACGLMIACYEGVGRWLGEKR